ncbi:MAG: Gfo/Idh/MocA family oxidoreductase [Acidimicrobiia bacterium]|nr:Gfo/Idh/MocA family oxidoreductase [Acidimicrobiia bacterium]
MNSPISVGLAGTGPWARAVHAPMFAAGPETRLAGIWSRTSANAEALAMEHSVPAFASFDELLDSCELVALAVPPSVQPALAERAARAGKALLLDKPLAADIAGAQRIADAVDEARVGSVVLLTYRFAKIVREFLREAKDFEAAGGRACFISGAFLSGAFAGGWRLEEGALLDVGPHILDLVDMALGPVVAVEATGDPLGELSVILDHGGGVRSEVLMSCTTAIDPSRTEVELFGANGTSLAVDARFGARASSFATLRSELVETARRGGGHPCDAARGLYLQKLLGATARSLSDGRVEIAS